MDWWVYAIIILVTVILIVVGVIYFFYPQLLSKSLSTSATGPYDLATTQSIFSPDIPSKFSTNTSITVQGFFFVSPLQRTASAIVCGTPGNPSCDDGRFHTCTCDLSNNCGGCTRTGYTPLIQVADVFSIELLSAPDAGRQGKVMAQLAIKTQTNMDGSGNPIAASGGTQVSQANIEIINLPTFPVQKWVMLTIVRDGRRFDVYYNDRLVASQKVLYMMGSALDSTKGVTVGNPGFSGYGGALTVYYTAQKAADISRVYSSSSDTRGAPYLTLPKKDGSPQGATGITFPSLCLTGSCGPTVRPSKPWMDWDSSYA